LQSPICAQLEQVIAIGLPGSWQTPIASQLDPPLPLLALLDTADWLLEAPLDAFVDAACWPLPDVESPPAPPPPVMSPDEHAATAPADATTAVHIHHFMILTS